MPLYIYLIFLYLLPLFPFLHFFFAELKAFSAAIYITKKAPAFTGFYTDATSAIFIYIKVTFIF